MRKVLFAICFLILVQSIITPAFAQLMLIDKNFKDTSELSVFIDSLYNTDSFSGIVAIAKGDELIYEHHKGFANKEKKISVLVNTVFNMASMTKMFTGVAIMQLVEKGEIKLNDAVSKYLPHYPNKTWADKATIQNLLTHTSGIGDFWPYEHKIKDLNNLQEIVDTIANIATTASPSDEMKYSNAGFYLLGRIIENASGENYFDYIQKNILDIAGMDNTYFERPASDTGFATGYMLNERTGKYESNEKIMTPVGGPAGGAFTNVHDLLAFQAALRNHKLLSEKYFKQMTQLAVNGRMGMGYGLGIGVGTMPNGVRWIGHNGGAPGIAANYVWFIDHNYSLIVFMNQDANSNMPLMMRSQMFVSELR